MRTAFGKLRKIISETRVIIPESEGMAVAFRCALGTENENSGYGREPQHFDDTQSLRYETITSRKEMVLKYFNANPASWLNSRP